MNALNEERFNKAFSSFILVGMTAALVLTTIIKAGRAGVTDSGLWLLIVSAFGSLMGILATVLSASGNILTFLFGLLDVSIYGAMCYINYQHGNSGLGNAILHFLYFVPMQFVGFFQWKKRGAGAGGKVKARRLTSRNWLLLSLVFIAGSVVAYFIIARFDKSAADTFLKVSVVLDVLPLMCNIIGQFLMSVACMEQWIFWIGVNITSILMWSFSMKGAADSYAAIYIIKYSFYLLNSINGLRIWIRLSRPGE
ncbi:MAG: nicotinamide riboside transporter PnuC [Bacteroidales bacterium]|nr:nicotinamide riboside transporter PnuC [Bacteroidales bacterium]